MRNLSILCVICVLFSCVQLPRVSPADYSDAAVRERSIQKAQKLLDSDPIEALLIAVRLCDYPEAENLFECAKHACRNSFDQAWKKFTQEKDKQAWFEVLRLYYSLQAVYAEPEYISEKEIAESERHFLIADSGALSQKLHENDFEKMISGIVTVVVDRGLKIEKGIGYTDIVIGSGFFIHKDGYIITNYHVIQSEVDPKYEGFSRLYIRQGADETRRIPAKVVGWDALLDIALLKTEFTPSFVFQLGASDSLTVGSRIYALGSPAGLERSVSAGIVSAKNRRFFFKGSILQIDAAVNPGSSGGPIIDSQGQVQAIVFAGRAEMQGLNFAIPVEILKGILPRLYLGGQVQHGWIGGFSDFKKESAEHGFSLQYVCPYSPLYYARVPEGAEILSINDIAVKNADYFKEHISRYLPGTMIRVRAKIGESAEDFEERDYFLRVEERSTEPLKKISEIDTPARALLPLFGLAVEQAGKKSAYRVQKIIDGSFAFEAGFSKNDYIEVSPVQFDSESEILYMRIYTKRRKFGYLDNFMMLACLSDNRFVF